MNKQTAIFIFGVALVFVGGCSHLHNQCIVKSIKMESCQSIVNNDNCYITFYTTENDCRCDVFEDCIKYWWQR